MAKVDIYHYSTPTSVTTLTLSNCDSSDVNDYTVMIGYDYEDSTVEMVEMVKPSGISGSTLTVAAEAKPKVRVIMVTQQG